MRSLVAWLALLTLGLALSAHAYIGHYARYTADDYCYAAAAYAHGLLGAQAHWYTTWSGRFAFTFAVSLISFLGPGTTTFMPAAALAVWTGGLAWIASRLRPAADRAARWTIGALLAVLVVFAAVDPLPDTAQALYWQVAMLTYVAPMLLWVVHAGMFLAWMPRQGSARYVGVAASALTAFVAGGFSETNTIMLLGLLGLAAAGGWLRLGAPWLRRAWPFLLAGMLGASAALVVVLAAPGNEVRQAQFPPPRSVVPLAQAVAEYSWWYVRDLMRSAWPTMALVWLLPAWLAYGTTAEAPPPRQAANTRLLAAWLLVPAAAFGLVMLGFAPAAYAVSYLPPDRVLIVPQFALACALAVWGWLGGSLLRQSAGQPLATALHIGLTVLVATLAVQPALAARRTLELQPTARAYALTWESFAHRIRLARAQGAAQVSLPAPENLFRAEKVGPNGVPCVTQYFGVHVAGYEPPPLPEARDLAAMTTVDGRIGDVAQVLGYQLEPANFRAGDTLKVRVYWLPLRQTDRPYTVFVHLFAPHFGSLDQHDAYPRAGTYDTTVWVPGRPFADEYTLRIPAAAARLDQARVLLGIYDLETLQRLPVTGADAGQGGEAWVELGAAAFGSLARPDGD
jgi:hypothetical protein